MRGGHVLDVERARRGDRNAFGRLAERHIGDLYRIAVAMVGADEARDATQETLIRAWRELPTLRQPERFVPWLRSIHINHCRNLLRARGRRPTVSGGLDLSWTADRGRLLEEPMERLHAAWAIDEVLRGLTDDERTVFTLHYVADLTLAEAARTLGIAEGTAKTRLHSGLVRLRRTLSESGEVVA